MIIQSQECCPGTNKVFQILEETFFCSDLTFFFFKASESYRKTSSLFLISKSCCVYWYVQLARPFPPWKWDGTSNTKIASVSCVGEHQPSGISEEEEGRVVLHSQPQRSRHPARTSASQLGRCRSTGSRAPAHTETCIFYGESRTNCCCLQLGNLLGKPDASAWFSELLEPAHSSTMSPESTDFKGSRPQVYLDPINAVKFIFYYSNLLKFKRKAYLLEHHVGVTTAEISALQCQS